MDDDLDGLMARLAKGDRSVFERVFELLSPSIARMCRSMLGNEADAADATQEAMTKIFQRASGYDCTRPAAPWAMAIAAWECRTIARKRSRRREAALDSSSDLASSDPNDEIIQRSVVSAAMVALGALSAADQEALTSTFRDEAASVSGATLRKRRERAVSKLRTTFRRLYGLD